MHTAGIQARRHVRALGTKSIFLKSQNTNLGSLIIDQKADRAAAGVSSGSSAPISYYQPSTLDVNNTNAMRSLEGLRVLF